MAEEFKEKRELMLRYRELRRKKGNFTPLGDRLHRLFDGGTFEHLYREIRSQDPLEFPDYSQKLMGLKMKTDANDAFVAGVGTVGGISVCAGELDKSFLMGSMSSAVGERLTALVEYADSEKLPLVLFMASGGARMQEGMYSLMQMAKTAAVVERFKQHGGLYIAVLTHPTTGGVSASFAMLGDVTLAEPHALVGFAGPRVIEQTIGEILPEGFQSSEFLEEHGYVDRIVTKEETRGAVLQLLRLHGFRERSGETDAECAEYDSI